MKCLFLKNKYNLFLSKNAKLNIPNLVFKAKKRLILPKPDLRYRLEQNAK